MYGLFISHTEAGQGNFFPAKLRVEHGGAARRGGELAEKQAAEMPQLAVVPATASLSLH